MAKGFNPAFLRVLVCHICLELFFTVSSRLSNNLQHCLRRPRSFLVHVVADMSSASSSYPLKCDTVQSFRVIRHIIHHQHDFVPAKSRFKVVSEFVRVISVFVPLSGYEDFLNFKQEAFRCKGWGTSAFFHVIFEPFAASVLWENGSLHLLKYPVPLMPHITPEPRFVDG